MSCEPVCLFISLLVVLSSSLQAYFRRQRASTTHARSSKEHRQIELRHKHTATSNHNQGRRARGKGGRDKLRGKRRWQRMQSCVLNVPGVTTQCPGLSSSSWLANRGTGWDGAWDKDDRDRLQLTLWLYGIWKSFLTRVVIIQITYSSLYLSIYLSYTQNTHTRIQKVSDNMRERILSIHQTAAENKVINNTVTDFVQGPCHCLALIHYLKLWMTLLHFISP